MKRRSRVGLKANGRLKKGYRFLKGGRVKKCTQCNTGHHRKRSRRRRSAQGLLF